MNELALILSGLLAGCVAGYMVATRAVRSGYVMGRNEELPARGKKEQGSPEVDMAVRRDRMMELSGQVDDELPAETVGGDS